MEGTVKWFNLKKGYGFIDGDDGESYFVHNSALTKGKFLKENDRVSFEAVETDKGKQAQKVTLLSKGSETGGRKRKDDDEEQEEDQEEEEQEEEQEETE